MKKVFEDKAGTVEMATRGTRTVELVWTPKGKDRKLERIVFRADEASSVVPAWLAAKGIPVEADALFKAIGKSGGAKKG